METISTFHMWTLDPLGVKPPFRLLLRSFFHCKSRRAAVVPLVFQLGPTTRPAWSHGKFALCVFCVLSLYIYTLDVVHQMLSTTSYSMCCMLHVTYLYIYILKDCITEATYMYIYIFITKNYIWHIYIFIHMYCTTIYNMYERSLHFFGQMLGLSRWSAGRRNRRLPRPR